MAGLCSPPAARGIGGSSQDVDLNFSEDRSSGVNLHNEFLKGMLKTANFWWFSAFFSPGSPCSLQ
jgi:hypothetical protein